MNNKEKADMTCCGNCDYYILRGFIGTCTKTGKLWKPKQKACEAWKLNKKDKYRGH